MEIPHNQPHYEALRAQYPLFVYESCSFVNNIDHLELLFVFSVNNQYFFKPTIRLPRQAAINAGLPDKLLYSLAFHIGMVEMISYWKAFCSPRIMIKPFALNPGQQAWWKKLFRHGLGEFFFTNGIEIPGNELFSFVFPKEVSFLKRMPAPALSNKILIPVGGGKDSVVSLELLKQYSDKNIAMVINHRGATREVLEVGGFNKSRVVAINRSIDPLLLQLNKEGFLNGHTPFSALLAFVSALCASLSGTRYIALSNESSANEVTIPNTIINHQYSKSMEFEKDFREYFEENVFEGLEYFSFLRPLNELQIGALFAGFKKYHPVFKSCNAGSKTDSWCGVCSKCLFTFIMLAPFIPKQQLHEIFGKDLFDDPGLIPLLEQLTGVSVNKPFECVGTLDEVNMALASVVNRRMSTDGSPLQPLLQHYAQGPMFPKYQEEDIALRISGFIHPHFLNKQFESLLQDALKQIQ